MKTLIPASWDDDGREKECPRCHGTGLDRHDHDLDCFYCLGDGTLIED